MARHAKQVGGGSGRTKESAEPTHPTQGGEDGGWQVVSGGGRTQTCPGGAGDAITVAGGQVVVGSRSRRRLLVWYR